MKQGYGVELSRSVLPHPTEMRMSVMAVTVYVYHHPVGVVAGFRVPPFRVIYEGVSIRGSTPEECIVRVRDKMGIG